MHFQGMPVPVAGQYIQNKISYPIPIANQAKGSQPWGGGVLWGCVWGGGSTQRNDIGNIFSLLSGGEWGPSWE